MYWEKFVFVLFCVFYQISNVTNDRVNFFTDEVRSLSELPMERLIKIRTNLIDDDVVEESDIEAPARSTALSLPIALPLKRIGTRKSIRRHEESWDEKGKDTKISKIFQLTITALSFLAFGGYVLTLIIMAIRRNQNNANPGNVIVFSNLQSLQKYQRPKRRARWIDAVNNDLDDERMYQGMIMLSQCYVNVR